MFLVTVGACACGEVNGPVLSLAASEVHDERGDTIDFSSGQPVHTHGGPLVDLAADGCPSVYKYAYLMTAGAGNPLAWNFIVDGIDRTTMAYRVRDTGDHVLLDWTKATGDTISLDRDRVPALGTYQGPLHLDVRGNEWAGTELSTSVCWDHHPLAAPLQIEPLAQADELAALTLAADAPISPLFAAGTTPIAVQRVVQYAAEPVVIDARLTGGALGYAKTVVSGYVPVAAGPALACSMMDCTIPPPAPATAMDSAGAFAHASLKVSIVDDRGTTSSLPFTIPARAGQPRVYRVIVELGALAELSPAPGSDVGEYALGGLVYTGQAPGAPITSCTSVGSKCSLGGCIPVCWSSTVFQPIVALDRARVDIAPIALDVRVSPSTSVPMNAPTHVPAASFTTPPITWDAGDDDLPGPF